MDRRGFLRNMSAMAVAQGLVASAGLPLAYGQDHNLFGRSKSVRDIEDKPLKRIAFGSCNNQNRPQLHWQQISKYNPDLWLWLGDNIYADWASPEQRLLEYMKVKQHEDYQRLISDTAVIGVWDDHDYGADNQNSSYKNKVLSQNLLNDFLDVELDHPTRFQEGIYRSDTFGPKGQQTQIISLDLRYFKKTPKTGGLLGEIQWQWLESTLNNASADLLILVTSLHLTSRVTGFGLEGWNEYPEERNRLYSILDSIDIPLLVLSGDRHMAEFIKIKLNSGKPLYEIMSSGLTHATGIQIPDTNRIGRVIGEKNYGVIDIDWSQSTPQVKVELNSAVDNQSFASLLPKFSY